MNTKALLLTIGLLSLGMARAETAADPIRASFDRAFSHQPVLQRPARQETLLADPLSWRIISALWTDTTANDAVFTETAREEADHARRLMLTTRTRAADADATEF